MLLVPLTLFDDDYKVTRILIINYFFVVTSCIIFTGIDGLYIYAVVRRPQRYMRDIWFQRTVLWPIEGLAFAKETQNKNSCISGRVEDRTGRSGDSLGTVAASPGRLKSLLVIVDCEMLPTGRKCRKTEIFGKLY